MDYIPARLVKGRHWYIVYYAFDPLTGKKERFRQSFDLNRIRSSRERIAKARMVIGEINRKLPYGYPYNEQSEQEKRSATPIGQAISLICELKCQGARGASIHTYRSMTDRLTRYLEANQMIDRPVAAFNQTDALMFMDTMHRKGIGASTYNNYITVMKMMFNALLERQYITINPWVGIKRAKQQSKSRRAFNLDEARIVIDAVKSTDRPLYLGILLQYHCFLRPNELRQLKVGNLDYHAGLIRIPGSISKNRKDDIITIPDKLRPILQDLLNGAKSDWYLFGEGGAPGPVGPVGKNTMGKRHMWMIRKLYSEGRMKDITGLSYYSWKDTGVTALAAAGVPLTEIMRQLRHHDLSMTQIYVDSLYTVNRNIKSQESLLI